MSETKCRLCNGLTNQEDGICRACALFRKDEVASLSVIPVKTGIQTIRDTITKNGLDSVSSTE